MWKFNWFGNKWKKKPYFSWTVQLILFVKEKQSQNFELYKYLKSLLNVKKGNMWMFWNREGQHRFIGLCLLKEMQLLR